MRSRYRSLSAAAVVVAALSLAACVAPPQTHFDWGLYTAGADADEPVPSVAADAVSPTPRPQTASAPSPAKPAPLRKVAKAAPPSSEAPRFLWPAQGPVIVGFGSGSGGQRNDGINIAAPKDAPILAAAGGTVSYVGDGVKGYGNLVLIHHAGDFFTAYAHADRLAVKAGERVEAGQIIGYCGATGDVDRPQLHFEIRRGVQPVDPGRYLAARS